MKKAAAGKSDILRAIEKDPELRPMVEHYFRPKLSEREPFEAFITDFNREPPRSTRTGKTYGMPQRATAASYVGWRCIACCV